MRFISRALVLLGLVGISATVQAQRFTAHDPELPRHYINTHPSAMPSNGVVHHLHAGASLQDTINAASPGDKIDIDAGVSLFCVCTLPAKVGADSAHWITVETASASTTEGVRLDTAQARSLNLAKLVDGDSSGAGLGLFATVGHASYYRFTNVELKQPVNVLGTYNFILLDTGSKHIAFDHVYIHGDSAHALLHAFVFNGAYESLTDSWCSDIHDGGPLMGVGPQTQCVSGWTGPGPYKIVNNYLSAAGENVIFGGASQSTWLNQNPADIEIRRNHFYKPLSWVGHHDVCNLLECKNCQRMLVEANIFENNWVSEQDGSAIVFQTADQYGIQPWTQVSDITFRYNWVSNADAGIAMSGHIRDYDSGGWVVPVNTATRRVLFENNIFDKVGIDPATGTSNSTPTIAVSEGTVDVHIIHNTIIGTDSTVADALKQDAVAGVNKGFIASNNVWGITYYGFFCQQTGPGGSTALNGCNSTNTTVPGLQWQSTGNLFYYYTSIPPNGSWGTTSQFPGSQFLVITAMPFTNFAARNYLLTTDYSGITTDHKQVGADITTLNAMLVGVP